MSQPVEATDQFIVVRTLQEIQITEVALRGNIEQAPFLRHQEVDIRNRQCLTDFLSRRQCNIVSLPNSDSDSVTQILGQSGRYVPKNESQWNSDESTA
jgi:hypothetical protein